MSKGDICQKIRSPSGRRDIFTFYKFHVKLYISMNFLCDLTAISVFFFNTAITLWKHNLVLQGLYYIPCTLKIWNIDFLFYSKFIGEYSHYNHTWNQDNENLNLVLWTPVLLCAHICYNSSIIAIRHTNVLRRYNFSDNFPCWEWFLLKKKPPWKMTQTWISKS